MKVLKNMEGKKRQHSSASLGAFRTHIVGAGLLALLSAAATSEALAANLDNKGANLTDSRPTETERGDSGSFAFAIGDRLKIAFFEQYASNMATKPAPTPVLSTLIERSEMSGEYVIEQDGNIVVPLLGAVKAGGETQEQLRKVMEGRSKELLGGTIQISLQVIDREPIYVMGDVAQPGTFKYVPGMTVLHAMVMAGGGTNMASAEDRWRTLDVSRERERLQKSEERLKTLLARMAVLLAEQEGRSPTAPPRLIDLAGPDRATELVAQAAKLRDLERQKLKGEEEASDALIAALENERTLLRDSMEQADSAVKENAERVASLETLFKRGLTTDAILHSARGEWGQALERWHSNRVSIARVEHNLTEVRREKMRVVMAAQVDGAREIKQALNDIVEEEVTRGTIGRLLPGLGSPQVAMMSLPGGLRFKIMRRTGSGLQELRADELSVLVPGDVLQITVPKEVQGAAL
jgi:protein involved in polysaccharide export with SLBB domain